MTFVHEKKKSTHRNTRIQSLGYSTKEGPAETKKMATFGAVQSGYQHYGFSFSSWNKNILMHGAQLPFLTECDSLWDSPSAMSAGTTLPGPHIPSGSSLALQSQGQRNRDGWPWQPQGWSYRIQDDGATLANMEHVHRASQGDPSRGK